MIMSPKNLPALLVMSAILALTALWTMPATHAEQLQRLGAWDVHYVLIPTSFLKPEIAARHGIARGRDRAMLNISVLGSDGLPVPVGISGNIRNLLEQVQPLTFIEVREGTAVYYLAEVKHSDREVLRLSIEITPPDGSRQLLQFQQQMFWDGR